MDSIIIQKYQPNNYEDVKRIFSLGMKEQISKGIKIGWKSPSVFGYLTFLFTFGYLFSFSCGIKALAFGLFFYTGSVYSLYTLYVRYISILRFILETGQKI